MAWHRPGNAEVLLIGPLASNFSENLIVNETFSFKKIHLKISSGKCRLFCLGLNVLKYIKSASKFFRNMLLKAQFHVAYVYIYVYIYTFF